MRDRTFENQFFRASGLNLLVAAIILLSFCSRRYRWLRCRQRFLLECDRRLQLGMPLSAVRRNPERLGRVSRALCRLCARFRQPAVRMGHAQPRSDDRGEFPILSGPTIRLANDGYWRGRSHRAVEGCPQLKLCQEGVYAPCCMRDEGWPFGVAL